MENGKKSMTIDELLAKLTALHAAATEGEWEFVAGDNYYVQADAIPKEFSHRFKSDAVGPFVCYVGNYQPDMGEGDCKFIVAAHNHYPALREEIKRLREENARLSDLAVQRANMIAQMDSQLSTAKRIGAAEELRRLADEWARLYAPGLADALRDRAAELEGK